ncbi:YdcF family protein [Polyangium aurulentum]|uniref:YdcF family protein n=1 Tax=Polyangium aurulentum TaxID=2567896 RepID=UPI00146D3586|nr:YdcF family protein [Polyangium aurulentum]UQA61981.1 YdcF family protein [Polyangium aurulentum]
MVDRYPGEYANYPLDPQPPASACMAAAHDVIIVLGCPNEPDGAPSPCQIARADLAVAFMDAGYGDHFITTGGAVHNEWVEADTLRDLLVARGIPVGSIVTEPKARHTDENIYYSTLLMEERDWVSALVVSEQRAHLTLTGLCDSNCCVDLGRLTVADFPLASGPVTAGHYVRYPWTPPVSEGECAQILQPSKFMCTNLSQRLACADNFQL